MRRLVSLTDSKGSNVNLAMTNSWFSNTGTWEALNPGCLVYGSGKFRTELWGVDLLAEDRNGNPSLVARLLSFWSVNGVYSNDNGAAQIVQGKVLNNDDQAKWVQTA